MDNITLSKLYSNRIYRLPLYTLWVIYVFRYKKFVYYLNFDPFKKSKQMRQVLMAGGGIFIIDIIINLSYILYTN